MGCYPLVPAYFTALYLEQVNGVVLLAFMYIGMTLFMPLTAAVKYGVTLIVMIGAVKLIDKNRAEAARARAEERLAHRTEAIDVKRAEFALRKALVRIDIAK